MKKVLLLSLSLVMGLCAFAQETVVKSLPTPYKVTLERKSLGNDVVVGTSNFEVRGTQSVVVNEGANYYDAEAIYTTYDLQSNSYLGNRMYQLEDGSVAVVATLSREEYDEQFLDRGTGYNFAKRGKTGKWGGIPNERAEAHATGDDIRTGWPTIAPYGAEGEILVNHTNGLQYYIREKAGQGEWDGPHAIPNPADIDEVVKGEGNTLAWPRVATTGENNDVVHIFANASGDTNVASYYLRTADLQNWDIKFSPLEMDTLHINFYAADDYVVSTNGDRIAVLYCAGFESHVMLYESADAGLTWESRMVWESPLHGKDWETDESTLMEYLYGPTHGSVAIGADGVSHVVLSVGVYSHKELGYNYSLYWGILTDGVAYWNDTTCWETKVVLAIDSLKVKDSTLVEKFEEDTTYYEYNVADSAVVDTIYGYGDPIDSVAVDTTYEYTYEYDYDTTIVVIDTLDVDTTYKYTYKYEYDTTISVTDTVAVDSTYKYTYEYEYDTTGVAIDSVAVDSTYEYTYEYKYDTVVVDSVAVDSTYEYTYDYVYDTTIVATDSVAVDSTYEYTYEYKYDTTIVATDSVAVDSTYEYTYEYKYDTVVVDTTYTYEYEYDSTLVVIYDSTVVDTSYYENIYDTVFRNDTVGVPSPIRASQDDSLKHALRMWWPSVENPDAISLDFTNFCACIPPHPEEGFNAFDYNMQYTGADGTTAGDYMMSFGLLAYPSIAVDPEGNLAVAFSAPDITRTWSSAYYMRSFYVNYKPADSAYWWQMPVLAPTNLYADFVHSGDECTFISAVSTPKNVNEFWFSCLSDDTPGFHTGSAGASQANITSSTVNVFKFNPEGNLNDADEEIGIEESTDVVYNIFPNPASEFICVSSSMDANATVVFTNIAGQTVKVVNTNLTTGDNTIVVNDLTSGVYFCTVTANGYSHTSKVVIK